MIRAKVQKKPWTTFRNPILYILVFLTMFLVYLLDITQLNWDDYRIHIKPNEKINLDQGFLIKTTGCRIPSLDPFDKSILKYVFKVKPFTCGSVPPLTNTNTTSLYIEPELFPLYNITNSSSVECSYQPFWRVDPTSNKPDSFYGYGDWKPFHMSADITDEFVQVVCKVNDVEIYKDFYSFVPVKTQNKTSELVNKLNVLVIGLDSISRSNFQRQMPKTRNFLLDNLTAVELIGYNKVGDNTFPNLIPILTGLNVDELTEKCWNATDVKFDACPFIWKEFKRNGYLTSYGEDATWMGVFNYVKRGFTQQPTDYYWRTFNYLAEKMIGYNKPLNADLCLGARPVYFVLLEYILKFVQSLRFEPYFAFFWGASLTHDNLNYPALGDDEYLTFFTRLKQLEVLNQTLLIVLSDHGMRWGDIRSTHQGHLEERLPFVFIVVPDWLQNAYPSAVANLRRNSKRLTTPFDLHETLKDMLNLEELTAENIKKCTTDTRGISLFLPVPENRTCASANISSHWCTCQESSEIDKNNTIIIQAADYIVDYMNMLLKGYKSCAKLELESIMDARLLQTDDYLKNNSTINDYTVIIKTYPGGGLFEATVRCLNCERNNPFEVTGTVSRLNMYGNQSSCVTDFHLKLYCFCGS